MKQEYDDKYPFSHDPERRGSSPFALVRHLYQEEIHMKFEYPTKVVSVSLPANEVALLGLIAKRFGMSMSALVASFLERAADQCFDALEPLDRLELGQQADLLVTQFELEQGITSQSSPKGFGTWKYKAEQLNALEFQENPDIVPGLKENNNESV
ncbi:MAG: hypothetical protein ACKOX3_03675 [Bacteroidota bacterium]